MAKLTIKEILHLKAEYPVRLIAGDFKSHLLNGNDEFIEHRVGDEVGIEAIDFSSGNLRCCNKSPHNNCIFYLYYDKDTGILDGEWSIKEKD